MKTKLKQMYNLLTLSLSIKKKLISNFNVKFFNHIFYNIIYFIKILVKYVKTFKMFVLSFMIHIPHPQKIVIKSKFSYKT